MLYKTVAAFNPHSIDMPLHEKTCGQQHQLWPSSLTSCMQNTCWILPGLTAMCYYLHSNLLVN